MPFVVELFAVQKDKVGLFHQLLNIAVPGSTIGVKAYMYALFLKSVIEGQKLFRLHGRLSSGEGDASASSEEGFLADSHPDDFLDLGFFSPVKGNGVRVCTIQASERASLKKYDEPEPRPVVCSHRFV